MLLNPFSTYINYVSRHAFSMQNAYSSWAIGFGTLGSQESKYDIFLELVYVKHAEFQNLYLTGIGERQKKSGLWNAYYIFPPE